MRTVAALAMFAALALLAGCGSSAEPSGGASAGSTEATETQPAFEATPVDVKALPLGDGKYTTDAEKKGYVYSCIDNFNGGGAFAQGPWIDDAAGTWNLTEKIYVEGHVDWRSQFSTSVEGAERELEGNGVPPQPSGEFPVGASDPAYQYDRNPNAIAEYDLRAELPANPERTGEASCVGGTIGVMKNGIPLFSAFDAGGRDAVATEIQDNCDAHPEKTGQYHYHGLSSCLYKSDSDARSELLGWALDGFGIYVERDAAGTMLAAADLDECHGRTSTVDWNGRQRRMYHYVMTLDFPYAVACYRGTAIEDAEGLALGAPGAGPP
jgi:YHYH protein